MAQETPGGAPPSSPTLIQRALQWWDAVRLLAALCLALVGWVVKLNVAQAQDAWEKERLRERLTAVEKWQERKEQTDGENAKLLTRAITLVEALASEQRRRP